MQKRQLLHVSHNHWRAIMQNDSNVETAQAEIPKQEYVLTVETHEGEMHTHPLSMHEAQVIGRMAVSGTARKRLLKNFFNSIRNQPEGKFSHIQKWLESILLNTKTKLFTVQMDKLDPPLEESSAMSTKSVVHIKFESLMIHDLENFIWNEDLELYEDQTTQICWLTFLNTIDFLTLDNDCMIDQVCFPKGTSVSNLIKHAEGIYKAEVIAQNSKIQFGTDDNKTWWAHEVPFFGTVQLDQIEEHGLVEWDIYFNECWQGPFGSKSKAFQHLEECIQEMCEDHGEHHV